MDGGPLVTRMRARLVAAAAICVLASGCVQADRSVTTGATTPASSGGPSTGPPTSGSASTSPSDPGRFRLSEWEPCDGGLECATLDVPLDWSEPDGEQISLAVGRQPMTGSGTRVGSVLFNPGGPGEPGVQFLRDFLDADRIPAGLEDHFDLVSWDPRGTGDSASITCTTVAELQRPDPDPTIDSAADVAAIDGLARQRLAACKAKAGDRLTFVGTQSTVRDMDALRSALGDDQLTFVGYSYGTILGTQYARMFPERVRAMVLDGVAIAGGDPVEDTHAQGLSFEKNFGAFLDDCAARPDCEFGGGDPRKAFTALVARLEAGARLPADYSLPDDDGERHGRSGTAGIGELYTAVIASMYSHESWALLETALAEASKPTGASGFLLLALRDQLTGRQLDGTWSTLADSNVAINCADQELRPDDADGDDRLRAAWSKEMPLLGSVFATSTPGCFGYPAAREPLTEPTAGSVNGVPPLVLVGSTGDPATPYAQAVELQKDIPGSVLVTWESEDHTAYGRQSSCLDPPLTAYLVSLDVPDDGLRCKP